jgi:hypothetical protein
VFSEHIKSVVVASKVAAVHHAGGGFRHLATGFDPGASDDIMSPDRALPAPVIPPVAAAPIVAPQIVAEAPAAPEAPRQ